MTNAAIFLSSFLFVFVYCTTANSHNFHADEITEYFDYNATLQGYEICSLISIVMDESSSMAGAQAFMRNIAVPEMVRLLTDSGVDHVFVCSHGFGTPDHNPFGIQDGHFHGCSEGTIDDHLDFGIMESWTSHGDIEDGWQAIHNAVRDIPSSINGKDIVNTCQTLGKSMILVSNEDRDDNICKGHVFHLEMKTDRFGTETSWKLQNSTGHVVFEDGIFPNNAIIKATTCLEDDGIHTLTFYDSYNDGFCCQNGDGYFKVWYDGDMVINSSAEFQSQISIRVPGEASSNSNVTTFEQAFYNASIEMITQQNTITKLTETGYSFDVITEVAFSEFNFALGVSSESLLFQPDGHGSFNTNSEFMHKNPIDLLNYNSMTNDYAPIAFATGGATWGLQFLKVGGSFAQSFAKAFTEMKAQKLKDDSFLTSSPTIAPTKMDSFPTVGPTKASIYSERIETTNTRRITIGLVTGGLLAAVAIAFVASTRQKKKDARNKQSILHCNLSDKGTGCSTTDEEEESIGSSEYAPSSVPSSVAELACYEDDISLDFLLKSSESFRDIDHLVDLGDYDDQLSNF